MTTLEVIRFIEPSRPPLTNRGYELLVRKAPGGWEGSCPYLRYSLFKNGKQINGMDAPGKTFSRKRAHVLCNFENWAEVYRKKSRVPPGTKVKVYLGVGRK